MGDIEIIDPRFRSMVLANAGVEKLADGFRWLEGPVWFGDHQCLLFSDIPNNQILRWTESGGISIFRKPAHFANGHARDRQGRLIGCLHGTRTVERTELDGTLTTLATHYDGKPLNSPNDLCVKSDNSIWFSDPPYGIQTDYEGGRRKSELPTRIYRIDPVDGSLAIATEKIVGPNGLCFSPDEKRLYVADTGLQFDPSFKRRIWVFTVHEDGRTLESLTEFFEIPVGNSDGICCDEEGNLWSSGGDGVYCISPEGNLLGKIHIPCTVANLCFGDRYRSRLFICATQTLYSIWVNRRGI